jgi:hypothetical protein
MICEGCGCSDNRPCVDPITEEPCSWIEPGLCSACAPEDYPLPFTPIPVPSMEFPRPVQPSDPLYRSRVRPRQVA